MVLLDKNNHLGVYTVYHSVIKLFSALLDFLWIFFVLEFLKLFFNPKSDLIMMWRVDLLVH